VNAVKKESHFDRATGSGNLALVCYEKFHWNVPSPALELQVAELRLLSGILGAVVVQPAATVLAEVA